jgi:large subunit ribosomal protein L9
MEIILLENITNLGNIGDKVTVKNGYGRNFLIKKGKALRFNKENESLVNKKKDELNKKNNEIKSIFKETAKIIQNKVFSFSKESKDNGELYGSIKPKEIVNKIKDEINAVVSPSQVILKEELNKIGIYKAIINFHPEVQTNISIKINKIVSK